MELEGTETGFFYAPEEKKGTLEFKKIGNSVDASFLSDEACNRGWFTGAMIGLCAQDLTDSGKPAEIPAEEGT
ncbi:MAG: hypothetical protein K6F63_00120 [Lachnospiraceae bacterium]|nr:hypothetical protein [Lachnospiraceae bacterium]